jgi:GntR family transcriptional regulator
MASSNSPFGVTLDPSDPVPLHEQAAAQIRRAIAEGQAKPGKRLPPAMDLAAVLGINRNTVLRALRLLREEGLLEFRRGRGITVAGTPEHRTVLAQSRELLALARQYGYHRDELIEIISTLP